MIFYNITHLDLQGKDDCQDEEGIPRCTKCYHKCCHIAVFYYHDHCAEDIHTGVRIISSLIVGQELPLRYVGTFLQIMTLTCPHL